MRAYIKRRVAKGIRMMSMGDARHLRDFDASNPTLLKEQRAADTPENMDAFMSIFGSRFGFYTRQSGRYLGVIIDDPMLAQMMVMFFDALWNKGQGI
jgi:sugar-specific transcriptional regulator TrmB